MLSAFQRLSAFALMLLAAAWLWAADLAAIEKQLTSGPANK